MMDDALSMRASAFAIFRSIHAVLVPVIDVAQSLRGASDGRKP
jgi:hypothetical protein